MSLTKILRPLFLHRLKALERYATNAEEVQTGVLRQLLRTAEQTEYGQAHAFGNIRTYDDFRRLVPLTTYDDLKEAIDRMRHGARSVLWPGEVKWYAKSSGTTNDRSKFIPVSPRGLRDTHYRGGFDALALYLKNNPRSRVLDGRALILGGSHQPNYNVAGSLVGDLSAVLIENLNPLAGLLRVPSKRTALLADFEEKRDRIARETMNKDVTNLSGVPSWMLSVLRRVLEVSGKENLAEVWPHLEVFFHGGIAFTPYRELYRELIPNPDMHYMETYNASEGFFGLQDAPADPAMLLMLDYGVFYEFVPLSQGGTESPEAVPVWGVEPGKNYALVISTSCGLWRYEIGDTVRFTQRNPYKFVISGRTKSFINAFGEELIVDNAERGLAEACRKTGAVVSEYTAAPVFMDQAGRCRHQWVVEFATPPDNLEAFAAALDEALRGLNSDYDAKRQKDITLQAPQVIVARPGLFADWLRANGKLGGQHKVPRLANDRRIIEQVLALNA